METAKPLAFGLFFIMIGFGLGRLRIHAIIRRAKLSRKKRQSTKITIKQHADILPIWISIHAQKNEAFKDTQKLYAAVGSTGLAAVAVIIATSSLKPLALYVASSAFLGLMVLSINPFMGLMDKLAEDFSSLFNQVSNHPDGQSRQISLPLFRQSLWLKVGWCFTALVAVASITILSIGIMYTPECKRIKPDEVQLHPGGWNLSNIMKYCVG